jgi:hypothetical protein
MYGVQLAHKIGDLVRITKSRRDPMISSAMLQRGSLGVVVERSRRYTKKFIYQSIYF